MTFRLADSQPASALREVEELRLQLKSNQPAAGQNASKKKLGKRQIAFKTLRAFEEKWLDAGHGSCIFRNPAKRAILRDSMQHFHGDCDEKRYWLGAFVVMPNHCHVLLKPRGGHELGEILASWKRWTSNRLGGGNFWQEESYDQIVRDTDHLRRIIAYLAKNPVSAKLGPAEYDLWMCQEWLEFGLRFDTNG